MKLPRLRYLNTHDLVAPHVHGRYAKDMIVLHETVSPDQDGLGDITAVENYLAGKDYGIHGMTDAEGHVAWARGLFNAIFWQAGGVNERSVGIEQVSNVMLRSPSNKVRRAIWLARNKQLHATAKLVAAICATHPGVPLRYGDGLHPGVTSHWDVSQHFAASEGHTDCWPAHKGGYYPIKTVIRLARIYRAAGVRLG